MKRKVVVALNEERFRSYCREQGLSHSDRNQVVYAYGVAQLCGTSPINCELVKLDHWYDGKSGNFLREVAHFEKRIALLNP